MGGEGGGRKAKGEKEDGVQPSSTRACEGEREEGGWDRREAHVVRSEGRVGSRAGVGKGESETEGRKERATEVRVDWTGGGSERAHQTGREVGSESERELRHTREAGREGGRDEGKVGGREHTREGAREGGRR